ILPVVVAVGLSRPEHLDVDPDLGEVRVPLECDAGAELLVVDPLSLARVHDEPALPRRLQAARPLLHRCFLHHLVPPCFAATIASGDRDGFDPVPARTRRAVATRRPVHFMSALTHDADKLIRQLSLVAYLMAEQRPVTARDVKNNVEGYANMGDEAFARRYYADRSELQGLGVPITSGRDEFTGEELYNLRQEHYYLPPIDLTDAELAALQTSFYLLEGQFAYAEPLRLALQNLALGRANTADPGPKTATIDLLGSVYTPEISQRLAKLEQAISKQRTIRFTYWTARSNATAERTINPYGLFELHGVWY